MTAYLSLGANQIQGWLVRTPKLELMRGASALLSARTDNEAIDRWLANGPHAVAARTDPGAGNIDGVVVLQVHDETRLATVAADLLAHLDTHTPGLVWSGWSVSATDYIAAVGAARAGTDPTLRRISSTPALQDLGLVRSCEGCRREPAGFDPSTGKARLGAGCAARQAEARTGRDRWAAIPGEWPDDFEHLAAEGGLPPGSARRYVAVGRRESRNHLATIVADGNNIGALFDLLRASPWDLPDVEAEAIDLLNTTLTDAVVAAAATASAPDALVKVVLPHFVGGDDLSASVPAPAAWRFVSALIAGFDVLRAILAEKVTRTLATIGADGPNADRLQHAVGAVSLGVGLCFANATHPFVQTHDRAEAAMRAAKRAGAGATSMIGWVDLTVGGELGPGNGAVVKSDTDGIRVIGAEQATRELETPGPRPKVFDLGPAARAAAWEMIRATPDLTAARDRVNVWDQRMKGRLGFTDPTEQQVAALISDLSRARWWPDINREED